MPNIKPPITKIETKIPKPLRIAPQPDQPGLSKAQKIFNTLVKQVESRRDTLAQWQSFMDIYTQKIARDYEPQRLIFWSLQAEMVHALDAAWDRARGNKILTVSERQTLQNLICEMAEHLIIATADDAIKAVYNKHSDIDFDAEEAAAIDSMKEAIEAMFDVDLDNADNLNSPDDIIAQLHAQMEQEHRQRLEEQTKHDARRKNARQTAKQRAQEEKLKTEADETNLSMREVYRKLVSALHPDREPDAAEHSRKTALMQRVNQAYEKKDLLQLLELQLAIEQIDTHAIAGLSEHRLKHFNKILQEQSDELKHEITELQMPLRAQWNFQPHQPITPKTVMPRLAREVANLKGSIRQIKKDMQMQTNLFALKVWIKDYRREAKERERAMRYEEND